MTKSPLSNTLQMHFFHDNLRGKGLAQLYRRIFSLAWPIIIGQGFFSIIWMISLIIIGQLGERSYNCVNIGFMVFNIIITVVAAIGVGTTSLVAQYWGRGDQKSAGDVLKQSLVYGAMFSVNVLILGIGFRSILFSLFSTDPESLKLGSQFLFWLFIGTPLLTPGFFLASALRGAGDTRTPVYVNIFTGVISLCLDYGLILGKLGLPKLGILGAAVSIDISYSLNSLILAYLVLTNKTILKFPKNSWRPDDAMGKAIVKIGAPSAMEWVLIQMGILIYVSVVTQYGSDALAGYFTGVAVLSLSQAVSAGFQTAATTLVGQAVGARNYGEAENGFRRTILLGFVSMGGLGVLMVFFATPTLLAFIFNKLNPSSIYYSRMYIMLIIYQMPLMGIFFSLTGGLRGAGDTIWPLIGSTVGVYGGRLLAAFLIYYIFHPPVYIIWCSMYIDMVIRLGITFFRLRTGKWKKGSLQYDQET